MRKHILFIIFCLSLLFISCNTNKKYSITFDLDGGTVSEELINSFKIKDNVSLPIPIKEGFLFIGWIDVDENKENVFVEELRNKNYNLKAFYIEPFEYETIKEAEIFNMPEDEYLIYVYRTSCSWCGKIKDQVLRYLYKSNLSTYSDSTKLYVINLTENGMKASIFRTYSGDDKEDDGFFVTGLTNINNMYLATTPALIRIKTQDGVKVSEFITSGATKVINNINSHLINKSSGEGTKIKEKYTIVLNPNGGLIDGNSIIEFYAKENVSLPTPTKDGYIFIGWTDGNVIINDLENKNYQLSALWIEPFEYKTIKENDIFNQKENEYFIYIYRDGCSWCSKIKNRVLAYIYKSNLDNYKESIKVYPLNLTDGGTNASIFRSYTGNNGQLDGKYYAEGLSSIDEMCIASTPALLRIVVENNIATVKNVYNGATNVITTIESGLKYGDGEQNNRVCYNITYNLNGGEFKEEPIDTFYSWAKISLPIPYKEGYVFIGWYEDDKLITSLENKDYELVAQYKEYSLPSEITINDIYSINNDAYYICFIRQDIDYYNDLVQYLTLFDELYDIYVIDLDKDENKSIKRSYMGEDGQGDTGRFYVNGVTSIDNLYIPKAAALIKIEKVNNINTSTYLSSGEDIISYFKNNIK